MSRNRHIPPDHPAFKDLPARHITVGNGDSVAAVHVSGVFDTARKPLVCIPGFNRNMSDFADFLARFHRVAGAEYPIVLVDLLGRGRSSDRADKSHYGSPRDAADIGIIATALGLGDVIFVGQGYGGQVAMAFAAQRPSAIAGTVLIDAGPVTDSRGIVRMRNNLQHLMALKGEAYVTAAFRKMLIGDYPGLLETQLDDLSHRAHYRDKRGRAKPLYDPYLIKALDAFSYNDVMMSQWQMFDALAAAPMLLLRTQLTDQLRRETFDEMARRRPDAKALTITGQGAPALLDHIEEVSVIVDFVQKINAGR